MKKTIHIVLRWLNYGFIGALLFMVLALAFLYLSNGIVGRYHASLERLIGTAINRPITIARISFGSRGLEPVVKLHDVVVFDNDRSTKLISAHRLDFGFDVIGSLITRSFKSNFLSIGGSELVINQGKDGKFTIYGFVQSDSKFSEGDFGEFLRWLCSQGKIDLRDFNLKINLMENRAFSFTNVNLKMHNAMLRHQLISSGSFLRSDGTQGKFVSDLKLQGDFTKNSGEGIVATGDVILDNCLLNFDDWNRQISSKGTDWLTLAGGKINLAITNATLINKLFRQPLFVHNLQSNLHWYSGSDSLTVEFNKLKVMDRWLDFMGQGSVTYVAGAALPVVDIRVKYNLANLNKAKLYYPASLLPKNALLWLDGAFIKSKKISGEMILQGDLAKFPFDHGEGKFVVDSNIRDVRLKYDGDWPKIDAITGKMIFSHRSMDIHAKQGKILGENVNYIRATIDDLEHPVLRINGEINSNSRVGQTFVNSSPLGKSIGKKLQNISLGGNMLLQLKFTMPLADDLVDKKTRVNGLIRLQDNRLVVKDWHVIIERCTGDLLFSEDGLHSKNFSGLLFNLPTVIEINTLHEGEENSLTRVDVASSATVQQLEQGLGIALQPYFDGMFNYAVTLDLGNNSADNTFKLVSDLVGTAVKLPEPFFKPAAQKSNFSLEAHFTEKNIFRVFVDYAEHFSMAFKAKRDPATRKIVPAAGELLFGGARAKIPDSEGLRLAGKISQINVDHWKEFLFAEGSDVNSMIREVYLDIAQFTVLGKTLNQLSLQGHAKVHGLEVQLTAREIDGKLFFPKLSGQPIRGAFKKIHLEDPKLMSFNDGKPEKLPPLDLNISDFNYGARHFDRIAFVSTPIAHGLAIRELNIIDGDFSLNASGEWSHRNGIDRTTLRGRFNSQNIGNLLHQWHLFDSIVGGHCDVSFNFQWMAKPYQIEVKKTTGSCALKASNGSIINLDKNTENKLGFSRILNILNLQSIPRRLALDFSDLGKRGFAFDSIVGNFDLGGGNVVVKKFDMLGPAAGVKVSGKIGMVAEDYDLVLGISPNLTSSIPVAATIAGGPVAGVVSFIADKVISSAIKRVNIYKYRITGIWSKPNVSYGDG